jgi:uncharacterized protein YyaL (SSP411 family)
MSFGSARNRLSEASSPYLLQHASNPVHWQEWGDEAFARARAEDKPVFLSIGYSTCHWCHVMAHESFENEELAAVLNEHFVPVKLDREERPDIDRVYMTFVQATTGHGGWPMSVWLTPDRLPFYGGTYFPPTDRQGRPGFGTILRALARVWREDRARVLSQGEHSFGVLRHYAGRSTESAAGEELDGGAIEQAFGVFWESFDEQHGGFGGAPKFPRPAVAQFLLRVHDAAHRQGNAEMRDAARKLAETTLRRMIAGGIHDHLGGGFHRYSVDAYWHIPHFEKMLYDQGQIVCNLVEAWQVSRDRVFEEAIRDTLAYVRRDLSSPDGAFYAAEDADSLRPGGDGHEHGEGAFYVWTAGEIRDVLGAETAELFAAAFGVEEGGNAPEGSDPLGEFVDLNTLIVRHDAATLAEKSGRSVDDVRATLAEARARLFAVREKRPRPHRDEKIVAAWNGLMISAFARAGAALGDVALVAAAVRAAAFVRDRMWNPDTCVLLRSRTGERTGSAGFAEDYACVVQAALDLYEATLEIRWLQWAEQVQRAMDDRFGDESGGGYFSSSGEDPSVLVRMKEDHDGAEPAPSSLAALNLLRLGRMSHDDALLVRAERTLRAFSGSWKQTPQAMPAMLSALIDRLQPPRQIVLAGAPTDERFVALLAVVRERFLPGAVLLAADGGEGQAWLAERAPWLRGMGLVNGKPAAYVCEDFACQLPVTEPDALRERLASGLR